MTQSSSSVDTRPTAIRFFNDHLIKLSKLNIKAFYAFHSCSHKCFLKDIKNKNIKSCIQTCQKSLEDYFTYAEQIRPYDSTMETLEGYETTKEPDQYLYRRSTAQLQEKTTEYTDLLEEKINAILNAK